MDCRFHRSFRDRLLCWYKSFQKTAVESEGIIFLLFQYLISSSTALAYWPMTFRQQFSIWPTSEVMNYAVYCWTKVKLVEILHSYTADVPRQLQLTTIYIILITFDQVKYFDTIGCGHGLTAWLTSAILWGHRGSSRTASVDESICKQSQLAMTGWPVRKWLEIRNPTSPSLSVTFQLYEKDFFWSTNQRLSFSLHPLSSTKKKKLSL